MAAQPHYGHEEEQQDKKQKRAGDRIIAQSACAFETLLPLIVLIVHPAISGGNRAMPAACSTNTAANTAKRYRIETPNMRRACGSRCSSRSPATRKACTRNQPPSIRFANE